jgi:diguanylate cyclase (GGDEF)-like protein
VTIHRLLQSQLTRNTGLEGELNLSELCKTVSRAYVQFDLDRNRSNRSMKLMIEEIEQASQEREKFLAGIQAERDRLNAAMENMPQGLAMFNADGNLVVKNKAYEKLFSLSIGSDDLSSAQETAKLSYRFREWPEDLDYIQVRLANNQSAGFEMVLGDNRIFEALFQPLKNGGWIETFRDVTTERKVSEQIQFLANRDLLTELANRGVFNSNLQDVIKNKSDRNIAAVLLLDLDGFKSVNDTQGHLAGDLLLKAVAKRISSLVRQNDLVARLGGDEFAILMGNIEFPIAATELAGRIVKALSEPFCIENRTAIIGVSIGIAIVRSEDKIADQIIHRADLALYCAKHEGKNTFRLFEEKMGVNAALRVGLEADLRRAIAEHEFELHYQPILDLATNQVKSLEALIRWKHPTKGYIGAADFIPFAEETGLIREIGKWVIHRACADAGQWSHDLNVAINLSVRQFESMALISHIQNALDQSNLKPSRLTVEITENLLLKSNSLTEGIMGLLRQMGVRVVMDDFGAGNSSLDYLRIFKFDEIKIDKTFIDNLATDRTLQAIVRGIVNMSREMDIPVVAEGVETQEQRDILNKMQCHRIQGYLIAKPMPHQSLFAKLQDENLIEMRPQAYRSAS